MPYRKPECLPSRPRQLWRWNIAELRAPYKWTHFSLYVIMDVYSRYVVGWTIAPGEESFTMGQTLIQTSCRRQSIAHHQLTNHSDRGNGTTTKTLAQLTVEFGVKKSLTRPCYSNDNPFSEAQFKTMKLRLTYPGRFDSLEDAKAWTGRLLHWYNHSHYHTVLALLVLAVVHAGQEKAVQAARQQVLQEAYAQHPERFVRGVPKVGMPPKHVWIKKPPDPGAYRRQTFQFEIETGRLQPQESRVDLQSPNCSLIYFNNCRNSLTHTALVGYVNAS